MPLELNAIDELIVLNHLETFRANGFDFDYDPNRPPLERLYLSAYPFSKNTQLGIEDVHELINSLRHYNDPKKVPNIRLSRLKRMFASRACRKSIMIGQPLDTRQQKKVCLIMSLSNTFPFHHLPSSHLLLYGMLTSFH